MTDFVTPESVRDLVPILLTDEEIEKINLLIKDMVSANKKNSALITIKKHNGAKIKSAIERLCKLGWRVYGKENITQLDPLNDSVTIMVDNPYYKCNVEWINEFEDHFKRDK